MSNKTSYFNQFAQILWNRYDLAKELRSIATYNLYYGTYITSPTTLRIAKETYAFAGRHGIDIKLHGRFDNLLRDPITLMEYHNARMFELSRAEDTSFVLLKPLKQTILSSVIAGIQYALLTQKCIIADPSLDDRVTIALGALHQKECYPCLLVCSKDAKPYWHEKIRALLPDDVQLIDNPGIVTALPPKAILIVEHTLLEKPFRLPAFSQQANKVRISLIVDEAHLFKNPEARRTQNMLELRRGTSYRLLLTDYPLDLSYKDLQMLLRILDRDRDFEDLYEALRTASRDPLINARTNNYSYGHQTILRRLHFKLRASCMVRRGEDRELSVQEHVVSVRLTDIPADLDPEQIKHPLHMIGVKKIQGAIDWLRSFLCQHPGKTMIFAHHNDVLERIAAALNIPTYYGKTVSEKQRNKIIQDFRDVRECQALMIANHVEIEWDFPDVTQVVYVEMPRSLSKYENLLNCVGNQEKLVSVYFLVSENFLDKRAQYRLQFREKEYDVVMDGGTK